MNLRDFQAKWRDATLKERTAAQVTVGNPPLLGGDKVRQELGDEYVEALFRVDGCRVPGFADLVCYFFERARAQIDSGLAKRAGLLATNSICGGANRRVLERINVSGDILLAWADRPWMLAGADVPISIVGSDDRTETTRTLDGVTVTTINPVLMALTDITVTARLPEDFGIGFLGMPKKGPFDIHRGQADELLSLDYVPNRSR